MFRKFIQDTRGMTLIDITIALLVISLMTVPLIQIYNVKKQKSINGKTASNQDAITTAIEDFYFDNGRYPCPADLTQGPGNPNYGREAQPCVVGGSAAVIIPGNALLRGGVPFETLKIPMSMTLDGWSRKITYTVTRSQTSVPAFPNPFPPGILTINTINKVTGAVEQETATAHYILVSHGENGIGAFNENGVLTQACPFPGPNFPVEGENCNDDFVFFNSSEGTRSLAANANYFDDIVAVNKDPPERTWTTSTANSNDIFAAQNVAVGINNPAAQHELDVRGNIRIDNNAGASYLCDVNRQNCFATSAFAGANPSMDCGASAANSTGMNGIIRTTSGTLGIRASCSTSYTAAIPNQTCPGSQRVVGITAGGAIQCAP